MTTKPSSNRSKTKTPPTTADEQAQRWRNRIIGEANAPIDDLLFHPDNWRIHPKHQQEALKTVLDGVGWVQRVIVNKRTGRIVDGHLRVTLADRQGEKTVPVVYVDLSEEEEAAILATLDPIAAMAVSDQGKLNALISQVRTQDAETLALLQSLTEKQANAMPPEDFAAYDETIDVDYCCPKCGYGWSGKPK